MNELQHKHTLPPGYELRGYRLRKVLGVGGFGVTYLAEHAALGRRKQVRVIEVTVVMPQSGCGKQGTKWMLMVAYLTRMAGFRDTNLRGVTASTRKPTRFDAARICTELEFVSTLHA